MADRNEHAHLVERGGSVYQWYEERISTKHPDAAGLALKVLQKEWKKPTAYELEVIQSLRELSIRTN